MVLPVIAKKYPAKKRSGEDFLRHCKVVFPLPPTFAIGCITDPIAPAAAHSSGKEVIDVVRPSFDRSSLPSRTTWRLPIQQSVWPPFATHSSNVARPPPVSSLLLDDPRFSATAEIMMFSGMSSSPNPIDKFLQTLAKLRHCYHAAEHASLCRCESVGAIRSHCPGRRAIRQRWADDLLE